MENELLARLDRIEHTQRDIQNQLARLQLETMKSQQEMMEQLFIVQRESQKQFAMVMASMREIKDDIAKNQKYVGTTEGGMQSSIGHLPDTQKGQYPNPGIGNSPHLIITPQPAPKLSPHFQQGSLPLPSRNLSPAQFAPIKTNVISSKKAKGKMKLDGQSQRQQFTPIPMSYGELYSQMLQNGLITPLPLQNEKTSDGKLPRNYDANARCEYHGGMVGHSIERCLALKETIQAFIDIGFLDYGTSAKSNQNMNPTGVTFSTNVSPSPPFNPRSQGQRSFHEKPPIDPIPTSYTALLPELIQRRLVCPIYCETKKDEYLKGYDTTLTCGYHIGSSGHSTEDCGALKRKVQDLVQAGILKF